MAEQPIILLRVTGEQANIIGAALAELPFRVAAPLIQELHRQVADQQPAPPTTESAA